jgi:glycogen debranching enzyme
LERLAPDPRWARKAKEVTQTTEISVESILEWREAASAQHAKLHGPATTSLQDGQSRTLKHDDTFAVFKHNGDALSGPGSSEGLYHRDTRYLSHFHLAIEGAEPKLLSSTLSDDNTTLTCDLTNPDLFDSNGKLTLPQGLLHIRRSRLLWQGSLFERLAVTNFDDKRQRVRLEIAFAADFADLFEVRGATRERRGQVHRPEVAADRVTLGYTGLDDEHREATVLFAPAPMRLMSSSATFELDLMARATQAFFIEVGCGSEAVKRPLPDGFFVALRDGRRALRAMCRQAASIATSNEVFNEALSRSVSDLYMLTTNLSSGPYPYAGIPWFSTVFGRDALITGWEMLWFDPTIARGVLRYLAANQAIEENAAADAEPGKILHEARGGEMAALGEVPFRRYYGSVDATPLFLFLAGAYLARTGDLDFIRDLWPNLESAVAWIDRYGDRDGDGFVEYGRRTGEGLANQGWKDSHDSIFHADGALARGPIAVAEVQAYVYGARRAMADISERLGYAGRAAEQTAKADALQRQFDRSFFDEALGTYALALDGDKRPCRVHSSNAGHALFAGIAYPERAASVVRSLMGRTSFSGWGVRTLASTEERYNPMSYHNGSVWPHDNAMIAAGFARYGFRHEAARIFEGLFAASAYIDLRRLPELFCGFPRQRGRGPTFYPVACAPQAWAAAAPLSLLQSCLGLAFDPIGRQITFDQPVLPDFLNDIALRRLSVGGRSTDVALSRAGSRIVVKVLSDDNALSVVSRA